MFLKRAFGTVMMFTLVGLITFFFPNWVFSLLTSALVGLSLYEFFTIIEKKGIFVSKKFGVIIGMLVPLIIYFQLGTEGYFAVEPFFIIIACLFTFVIQFTRRDNSQALANISVTMFALLYIAWFFSFFVMIKFLPRGAYLVAFVVLVTKMGDIGAYLIGRSFGRHSLIPRISPNKTIEGTAGGLVFSVATALIGKSYLPNFSYYHLAALGVLLGILAQVGDLAQSLLKRDCGVKDSGNSFSGFGGVFDLVDSLIFTTPIFYFYVVAVIR